MITPMKRILLAGQIQLDADLVQPQRRQDDRLLGLGQRVQDLDDALQRIRRGHGHREPDVERVVALVVVRHAGMLIDHLRGLIHPGRGDLHRGQRALVAQRVVQKGLRVRPRALLPPNTNAA